MNPYPYGPPPQGYAPAAHQQAAGPAMYRANVFVPPGARGSDPPTPGVRKMVLATGIVQTASIVLMIGCFVAAGVLGNRDGEPFAILGALMFGLWYIAILAYSILNVVWIYKIWSWIPPEQRWTNLWKKYTSPGQAAGFMFIPYFNIYWMFVVYFGICDVFERLRVAYPTDKKSPKDFAIAMLIVSMIFFPAAPFMHYVFEKRVEALAHDFHARMAARPIM